MSHSQRVRWGGDLITNPAKSLVVKEFAFELRLCARLEADGALVARQLGAGVRRPGGRVVDVLQVEPGPSFEERTAISDATIPDAAIEADVGPGRGRPLRDAFPDTSPEWRRTIVERAVEVGFLERERRDGREYVRQAARYPADWFGRLRAVENKPDLGTPGALRTQLRSDVALGLVDEVVLATESRVTGAHLNRIPDPVGIWRFVDDEIEVIREPECLPVDGPGVELLAEHPGRTDVSFVSVDEKARVRRRIAERAYGKGWRTYELPGCANAESAPVAGVDGLPFCTWYGRIVDPASECGSGCPGHVAAPAPDVDLDEARAKTSPWVPAPEGWARRQSGLDRFG